jgi:CheY-like chemotaxis protein
MATVLVIDDDPLARAFSCSVLRTAGYGVREASDGDEGLQAYRGDPADVVLCDLDMPVRDGLGVIAELRRDFPAVKVVATSGGGFLWLAESLGVAVMLSKPFAYVDLVVAVERALGG